MSIYNEILKYVNSNTYILQDDGWNYFILWNYTVSL